MITDVYLVYDEPQTLKKFKEATIIISPFYHFINERSKDGKKEAFALKGHWGARQTPFAICFEGEKALKAFYSETGEDIVNSLIRYLNESSIQN